MAVSDLTSLANVKTWLGDGTSVNDTAYSGLITGVSRAIYTKLQRPNILPAAYSETLDGGGSDRIMLKNWPVISVTSLTMGTLALSPSVNFGSGYVLETVDPSPPSRQAMVYYRGGRFWDCQQNVSVSYVAGYQVTETQAVASGKIAATQPYGPWGTDQGVTYASTGIALTPVLGSPLQGQYSVSAGEYTFNAADDSESVILAYGFIPADLAQAATEWIAARFKAQSFIGLRSKSLGGQETITYDTGSMPAFVTDAIQPFKRVAIC